MGVIRSLTSQEKRRFHVISRTRCCAFPGRVRVAGSRDNIANLYVFSSGGFNTHAAEFVTSIGGTFTMLDYEFCGIYGLYKYRGSVIMEEWQVECEPVKAAPDAL